MNIGLDIGGTKILGGLFADTKLLKTFKIKTKSSEGAAAIYERIRKVIDELLIENPRLEGIGLGIPGNVDVDKGVVLVSPNLPFSNFNLKKKLEADYKVPVVMDNDVNVGLLGEHWMGAAKGSSSAIGLFIGTGIGGAIILNGKLVRGAHNLAGEIGHMTLTLDGPQCNCGAKGCFETYASKLGMQRELEAKGFKFDAILKSSFLKKGLDGQDKAIKDVLKHTAHYLGEAIGSLVNFLDPEIFVLGGGVMETAGEQLLKWIEPVAEKRALAKPKIKLSSLGDHALLYGGAKLLLSKNG